MQFKSAYISIALACVVVGLVVAAQFKVTGVEVPQRPYTLDRPRALVAEIDTAREKKEALQHEVDSLRKQMDEAVDDQQLDDLKASLNEMRSYAGLTELKGPGVLVTLNDSQAKVKPGDDPNFYVLHSEDVLRVLNELKAAGAEAISMDEHRVIMNTEVRCVGPTVLINKSVRLSPPFEIKAIGHADTLLNALRMKGGLVDSLKYWGIEVEVEKAAELVVPPYEGGLSFNFTQLVE